MVVEINKNVRDLIGSDGAVRQIDLRPGKSAGNLEWAAHIKSKNGGNYDHQDEPKEDARTQNWCCCVPFDAVGALVKIKLN